MDKSWSCRHNQHTTLSFSYSLLFTTLQNLGWVGPLSFLSSLWRSGPLSTSIKRKRQHQQQQHISETSHKHGIYTLLKKKTKFSSYKRKFKKDRVQSHKRKGFLIREEMRKYISISEEAVSHIWIFTRSLWISIYMRKTVFSFLSVQYISSSHTLLNCKGGPR